MSVLCEDHQHYIKNQCITRNYRILPMHGYRIVQLEEGSITRREYGIFKVGDTERGFGENGWQKKLPNSVF